MEYQPSFNRDKVMPDDQKVKSLLPVPGHFYCFTSGFSWKVGIYFKRGYRFNHYGRMKKDD